MVTIAHAKAGRIRSERVSESRIRAAGMIKRRSEEARSEAAGFDQILRRCAAALDHLVVYPSVAFVAVWGLSHSALPSAVEAVRLIRSQATRSLSQVSSL